MDLNKRLPQGVLTILKEDQLQLEKMELLKCGTFQMDSALQSLNQKLQERKLTKKLLNLFVFLIQKMKKILKAHI